MRIAIRLPVFAPLVALLLAACAPAPIYQTPPGTVAATPMQVAQTPERYARANVIWGGTVVSVKNLTNDTEIEVLAFPLDSSQRPRLKGNAAGSIRSSLTLATLSTNGFCWLCFTSDQQVR